MIFSRAAARGFSNIDRYQIRAGTSSRQTESVPESKGLGSFHKAAGTTLDISSSLSISQASHPFSCLGCGPLPVHGRSEFCCFGTLRYACFVVVKSMKRANFQTLPFDIVMTRKDLRKTANDHNNQCSQCTVTKLLQHPAHCKGLLSRDTHVGCYLSPSFVMSKARCGRKVLLGG